MEFELLTFNIFVRPFLIFSHFGGDNKKERLEEFLTRISSYSIICLQELFSKNDNQFISNFIRKAKEMGYRYTAYFPKTKGYFKIGNSGLCVLSRYKIVDSCLDVFSNNEGFEYFAEKGVMYCKIQLTEKFYLHLFTSHLKADNGLSKTQSVQLDHISKLINSKCIDDNPFILTGDFNIDALDTLNSYKKMKRKLFANNFRVIDTIKSSLKFHPVTNGYGHSQIYHHKSKAGIVSTKGKSLDYIFLGKRRVKGEKRNLSKIVKEAKVEPFLCQNKKFYSLSDHYGVSVKLDFNKF